MDDQTLQRCDNCLKQFPQSKIATHFGYCRRNIKKCATCQEMFDINFKEQHEEQYHKQQNCPHCSSPFSPAEIKNHQKNCNKKPKYCQYCDLNVPVNTYPTHLKACQSRTKPCTKCNVPITNKDYYLHIVSCQGPKEEVKPTRNYQEHIQQQRRIVQQNSQNVQKMSSREKAYGHPTIQSNNAKSKDIAANLQRKPNQPPKLISYNPPPRQEIKVDDKKDYIRQQQPQPRIDPKRQQIRSIPNAVNPPTYISNNMKKEDPKPIGRIFNQAQGSSMPTNYGRLNNNDLNKKEIGNKGIPNRQPINQNGRGRQQPPVTNNEIFPKYGNTKGANLKDGKSIEKQYGKPQNYRKEEKLHKQEMQTNQNQRSKAPESKKAIENKYTEPRRPQQQYSNQHHSSNEIYGVGAEQDHQLQMAIMQSLGQESKGGKGNGSYLFQNEMMSESFIEKQKAIEAGIKKNSRK